MFSRNLDRITVLFIVALLFLATPLQNQGIVGALIAAGMGIGLCLFWRSKFPESLPWIATRWRREERLRLQIQNRVVDGLRLPETARRPFVSVSLRDDEMGYDAEIQPPQGFTAEQVSATLQPLKESLELVKLATEPDNRNRRGGLVKTTLWQRDPLEKVAGIAPIAAVLQRADHAVPKSPVSVWNPVPTGLTVNGEPVSHSLASQTSLVAGSPGAGKSAYTWQLLLNAAADAECFLAVIDLKPEGIETGPIRDRADLYITETEGTDGAEEAVKALQRLDAEMLRRSKYLASTGKEKLDATDVAEGYLPIMLFVDEAAQFIRAGSDHGKEALRLITRLVEVGRAVGIGVVLITQKPASEVIPTGLRDLLAQRICFRTGNRAQAEVILGTIAEGVEPWTISKDLPGSGYALTDGDTAEFRSFFLSRETIKDLSEQATEHVKWVRDARGIKATLPLLPAPSPDDDEPEAEKPARRPRKPRQRRQ